MIDYWRIVNHRFEGPQVGPFVSQTTAHGPIRIPLIIVIVIFQPDSPDWMDIPVMI